MHPHANAAEVLVPNPTTSGNTHLSANRGVERLTSDTTPPPPPPSDWLVRLRVKVMFICVTCYREGQGGGGAGGGVGTGKCQCCHHTNGVSTSSSGIVRVYLIYVDSEKEVESWLKQLSGELEVHQRWMREHFAGLAQLHLGLAITHPVAASLTPRLKQYLLPLLSPFLICRTFPCLSTSCCFLQEPLDYLPVQAAPVTLCGADRRRRFQSVSAAEAYIQVLLVRDVRRSHTHSTNNGKKKRCGVILIPHPTFRDPLMPVPGPPYLWASLIHVTLSIRLNAKSIRTDNFTVTGPASMQTRRKDFERPPDCFSLTLKKSGVKMGYLAVHVSPRSVFDEMEALYDVASECETYAGTSNLVILGDMNADCSYLTKEARDKLRLKKDSRYKWRILDDMDTTVSPQKCAYDRVIVKGLQMERRIPKANPFNFTKEYRLDLAKVGCLVVLHLNT
ncbi:deoxyribonuclease [Echinococcus multilocularis]|uniref:Deoxyribonuclease n=1 Tax=Echinococcus multilocularis TaxID=6211 RepID=A0A068XWE4_ECHMU|nr:deoxyribonuclease [Echinococcus multilocularis]